MRDLLSLLLQAATLTFAVASMLSVGAAFTLRDIVRPLGHVRRVLLVLVGNFVLVPLLALGIVRVLPLAPSIALGVVLLGIGAGAPFLVKLTHAARGPVSLSATLLVLLVPVTCVYMALVVPYVLGHPALTGIVHASVSATAIAVPLLLSLMLPLALGLVVRQRAPRAADRVRAVGGRASTWALLVLIATTVALHGPTMFGLIGTGALAAVAVLVGGAVGIGLLVAGEDPDTRIVVGLGTGQRNIAAAMVVASQGVEDPDTLVLVVAASLIGMVILFPVAHFLRSHGAQDAIAQLEPVAA